MTNDIVANGQHSDEQGRGPFRLAIVASHPIQYQAPYFRALAQTSSVDVKVFFCWDFGVDEAQHDPGFGHAVRWDVPLLEGYDYEFVANRSPRPSDRFLGQLTPGLFGKIRRGNFDAVLVHGYALASSWIALAAARACRTPVLFRGESHLLKQRSTVKEAIRRAVLPALFSRVAAFLVTGRVTAETYRHYGVPDSKLFLAPYSVDNAHFQKALPERDVARRSLLDELGVAGDLPIILYVAKLYERKRPADLLHAFRRLPEEIAMLLYVGDGVDREKLERIVREQSVHNVHFAGFRNQSELPAFYAAADVFVLPSGDEPWGLVINEAMCAGLPIITTNAVGAAQDLVEPGASGFLYEPGDVEALSRHIHTLVSDPERRRVMGERSQEIIGSWDIDRCVRATVEALCMVTS